MEESDGAPRIFGIVATEAPVVAVIRRGPTAWSQIGRLTLDPPGFEPGAWFKGRVFPQKCDLSPNGRWLAYSAEKKHADWAAGEIYEAISRLPWLDALVAWEAGTTYTRGIHFVDDRRGHNALGTPDVGDLGPCLRHYSLAVTRPDHFAVERRRGWRENDDTPARDGGGFLDENRAVTMERDAPGGAATLRVSGSWAAFRSLPWYREAAVYELVRGGVSTILDHVQWADWGPAGQLVLAFDDGRLAVAAARESGPPEVEFEVDLAAYRPAPERAPSWARGW